MGKVYIGNFLKNSILAALGYDAQLREAEDEIIENSIKANHNEHFSEENLIRKIIL